MAHYVGAIILDDPNASEADCEAAFVAEMAKVVSSIGCTDSTFTTPSGLSANGVHSSTTCIDILKIGIEAASWDVLNRIWNNDTYTIQVNGTNARTINISTTVVSQSAFTVVANGNIVKKVYFPREILPLSVVTSGAVNFMISTLIILAFVIFSGLGITKYIIFYPVILIIQFVFQLGIAFILSAITVYLRDIEHFVQIALMVLFYATPIVYSGDSIPEAFRFIITYNPMAHILEGYRDIFYNQTMPDIPHLALVFGLSIVLCIFGYFIFKKLQKGFAEEL